MKSISRPRGTLRGPPEIETGHTIRDEKNDRYTTIELPPEAKQQRPFQIMHHNNKSQSVFYRLTLAVFVATTCDATSLSASDDSVPARQAETPIFVPEHVQAILATHCLDCHNKDNAEGTIQLDEIEWL